MKTSKTKAILHSVFTAALMVSMLTMSACSAKPETADKDDTAKTGDPETMYQISLLQGLTEGDFEGSVTAAQFKKMGNTGIGTFDGLDGELVMLDGMIYRAAGDGSVNEVSDEETIPFGNTTMFSADKTLDVSGAADFKKLQELLNQEVKAMGENYFYAVRIDGVFSEIHVRSEYKQKKPYPTIVDALAADQTFFDYQEIEGTMVGVYCPGYMSQLNNAGWHFHFISKDRTKGGHVLEVKVKTAEAGFDLTDGFQVALPDSEKFLATDFTVDRTDDVKKAETNQ